MDTTLEEVHHSEVEVYTTRPPVCEDNQSESRKGTGRSGVSPPGEFDSLTVPLLVQKDSNNSSNNNSKNSNSSEDESKDVIVP
jgi:hypothetical protein